MTSDIYTTDIVYPSAFGAFQSPVHLLHAAWLGRRVGPDIHQPFAYVDLGCGAGLTACVLAECYPHATFHGVDINPEHIRRGRELANRAGLTNLTFHQADFASIDELPLSEIAFVGLSGIYSWLDDDRKRACMRFIGHRLAGDGLVFLHYAALPGNAQIDALYALIREAARIYSGDSVERFRAACLQVERLRKAGARFFKINPQADAWMARLPEEDGPAMAHEVLNSQRTSLSARDVATDAERVGLKFVANAQIELNHLELAAPDVLRRELAAQEETVREIMMDAVRNTHSRMDVLMRATGAGSRVPSLWVDRLNHGPAIQQRRDLSARTGLDLMAAVYSQLLYLIERAPLRIADLLAEPSLSAFPDRELALQQLAALKLVHLLREPFAKQAGGRPVMASRLNQLVLEEQIDAAGALPFASPAAGTQVLLGLPDRLVLLQLMDADLDAAWVRISAKGQRVTMNGMPVNSAGELHRATSERTKVMGEQIVANLVKLGVLSLA